MNKLTQAETERLALLIEECGEVQHMAAKILRHGYNSTHADYNYVKNRDSLRKELLDLKIAIDLIYQKEDVNSDCSEEELNSAIDKKNKFLHHNNIEYAFN